MIVCRMRRMTTSEGAQRLVGTVNQDVPKNCMLMLKKKGDDDYELWAVCNDGRRIDRDPQSLLSLCELPQAELAQLRQEANDNA